MAKKFNSVPYMQLQLWSVYCILARLKTLASYNSDNLRDVPVSESSAQGFQPRLLAAMLSSQSQVTGSSQGECRAEPHGTMEVSYSMQHTYTVGYIQHTYRLHIQRTYTGGYIQQIYRLDIAGYSVQVTYIGLGSVSGHILSLGPLSLLIFFLSCYCIKYNTFFFFKVSLHWSHCVTLRVP